jgi:hypothetical protein
MKKITNNHVCCTSILVLLLTISAIAVTFPGVTAQGGVPTKATIAYLGAMPNPLALTNKYYCTSE